MKSQYNIIIIYSVILNLQQFVGALKRNWYCLGHKAQMISNSGSWTKMFGNHSFVVSPALNFPRCVPLLFLWHSIFQVPFSIIPLVCSALNCPFLKLQMNLEIFQYEFQNWSKLSLPPFHLPLGVGVCYRCTNIQNTDQKTKSS